MNDRNMTGGTENEKFCTLSLLFLILNALILSSCQPLKIISNNEPITSPKGYELVWHDEFNNKGRPNPEFWTYEKGFVRNLELQYYRPQNAKVNKGKLNIEGKRQKVKNRQYDQNSSNWRENRQYSEYTSSSVTTEGLKEFKYGIFEFRAKLDPAEGLWPAIWTLGTVRPWPENGEIDILEFFRIDGIPTLVTNVVWLDEKGKPYLSDSNTPLSHFTDQDPDWIDKYHIWKLEWTEDHIKIFIDEVLYNEVLLADTYQPDGYNPFHDPHYILINLAIGAGGGDPNETRFPRKLEVDYVRVFQKKK